MTEVTYCVSFGGKEHALELAVVMATHTCEYNGVRDTASFTFFQPTGIEILKSSVY